MPSAGVLSAYRVFGNYSPSRFRTGNTNHSPLGWLVPKLSGGLRRPVVQRIEHQLYAARNPQFFEDSKQIFFHRVLAQSQFAGDIAVRKAIRYQRDHLLFPRSKQDFSSRAYYSEARRLTY